MKFRVIDKKCNEKGQEDVTGKNLKFDMHKADGDCFFVYVEGFFLMPNGQLCYYDSEKKEFGVCDKKRYEIVFDK